MKSSIIQKYAIELWKNEMKLKFGESLNLQETHWL
jgi:hypothetical protein